MKQVVKSRRLVGQEYWQMSENSVESCQDAPSWLHSAVSGLKVPVNVRIEILTISTSIVVRLNKAPEVACHLHTNAVTLPPLSAPQLLYIDIS